MLAPSLATMLCVITTDAVATPTQLDQALRAATAAHLRPARRRRQLLDQRHRAAAGLGCQRDHAQPGRTRRRRARPSATTCARQLQADAEGVTKRVAVTVTGAASEDDALDRRPDGRPRQPGQDRAVRLRPELGPGARRRRHRAGRAGPGPDHACRSTASPVCIDGVGAPGAREVDLSGDRHRRRRSTSASATAQATIRTTDLSHAYVEENSAYSLMTHRRALDDTAPRRTSSPRRCRGCSSSTARSSSSSTAATR